MAGPLVAGYESDSGSDTEDASAPVVVPQPQPQPPSASQPSTSKLGLPPPRNAPSVGVASGGGGLALPPPKHTAQGPTSKAAKRKAESSRLQIRVGSLHDLGPSDDPADDGDGGTGRPMKKQTRPPVASGTLHALFGMLPAPKSADQIEREKAAEAERKARQGALRIAADADMAGAGWDRGGNDDNDGLGISDAPSIDDGKAKKGKGNDDFRAMLGLKPATPKPKATAPAPGPPSASVSGPTPTAGSSSRSAASIQISNHRNSAADPALVAPPGPSAATSTAKIAAAPIDFFSLDDGAAKQTTPTTDSATSSVGPRPLAMSISAAPILEDTSKAATAKAKTGAEVDGGSYDYRGWQQDPDGSWVPVTPEAQAAYAAWQAAQQAEAQMAQAFDDPSRRRPNNGSGGGGFDIGELARAGLRQEDLASVDAAKLVSAGGLASGGLGSVDARYASAAAEVASAATDHEVAAGKKTDKMTNQRAKQKGQLTSLLAHANEKRRELEEKWAKGRAVGQAAAAKYGFR
ncbi:hypothetical protein ACQY0O_002489 [Thecaphora frezii]